MADSKQTEALETEPSKIAYYCKDCKRLVGGVSKRGKKKYSFKCSECGGSQVAYGSEKSIINFFRIKPAQLAEWGVEVEAESLEKKPEKSDT